MDENKKKKKTLTLSGSSTKSHSVPNYSRGKGKTSVVIEKKPQRRWGEKKFEGRNQSLNKSRPSDNFIVTLL